jgi:hypothetical protein
MNRTSEEMPVSSLVRRVVRKGTENAFSRPPFVGSIRSPSGLDTGDRTADPDVAFGVPMRGGLYSVRQADAWDREASASIDQAKSRAPLPNIRYRNDGGPLTTVCDMIELAEQIRVRDIVGNFGPVVVNTRRHPWIDVKHRYVIEPALQHGIRVAAAFPRQRRDLSNHVVIREQVEIIRKPAATPSPGSVRPCREFRPDGLPRQAVYSEI